jgi:hypothetical protein
MEVWKSTSTGGCGEIGPLVEQDLYLYFLFSISVYGEFGCWVFRPVSIVGDIIESL